MADQYVGEIRLVGFGRPPVGWLACDGSLQSIANFEVLFVLLGTTYGGDGVTTFGLPDLRSRVAVGQGSGIGLTPRVMGQMYGAESVTMTLQTLPAHTHSITASADIATTGAPATNAFTFGELADGEGSATSAFAASADSSLSPVTVANQGNSNPISILSPVLAANYIIATVGIFPSRS